MFTPPAMQPRQQDMAMVHQDHSRRELCAVPGIGVSPELPRIPQSPQHLRQTDGSPNRAQS